MSTFYLYLRQGFGVGYAFNLAFGRPWHAALGDFVWRTAKVAVFVLGISTILDIIERLA